MPISKIAKHVLRVQVNGIDHECEVEPRLLLSDFLRIELGLTGTHVGCEQGICGACSVLLDGKVVRSCLMLAVQANGSSIRTIESIAESHEKLHPIQEAFIANHAVQCGFCTPGMIMATHELLRTIPDPTIGEIREALSGNICRCTGYTNIVKAVQDAAKRMRD